MATTFKVGDKVNHASRGEVEITYGPYASPYGTRYLVRLDSATETHAPENILSAIPDAPKFKVGDKVTEYGIAYTIHAGPFYGDTEWYAVENEAGKVMYASPGDLAIVEEDEPLKVGDKVKVVSGRGIRSYTGRTVTLTEVGSTNPYGPYGFMGDYGFTIYAESVELVEAADTYTHNGVTYDLSARYRDRDGDYWTFKDVDGTVRGNCAGTNVATNVRAWCDSLEQVARRYGPLTRVNA